VLCLFPEPDYLPSHLRHVVASKGRERMALITGNCR
jgi:hypothetical protein